MAGGLRGASGRGGGSQHREVPRTGPLAERSNVARAPPPRSAAVKGVSRALTVHRSGFVDPRTSYERAGVPPLAAEQSCPEIGHMTAPVFLMEPCKVTAHSPPHAPGTKGLQFQHESCFFEK